MWDDRYNILLVIEKAFELYALHRKPLHPIHKDTIKRLALVYVRLGGNNV